MNRRDMLRSSCALAGVTLLPGSTSEALISRAWTVSPAGSLAEPFTIDIARDRIADLRGRIDAMVWPEVPFETGWAAGTSDQELHDLVHRWREQYDWFQVQDELNHLPHHQTTVSGECMHFVWYRGQGERQPFPLLLLHGWPSSFLEFADAAPLLVNGRGDAPGFDLVVPSLPGFLFSEAPHHSGMDPLHIGERLHALMGALGYERYGVDGNDWGGIIADDMARLHPEALVGLHKTGTPWARPKDRKPTTDEQAFLSRYQHFWDDELNYFWLQATKPQTLAYALQDSPVGLASWFLEKWWAWADDEGDLWTVVDRDTFLTTATLYWLTDSVLSASRVYYEFYHHEYRKADVPHASGPITVPTWFAGFPGDPFTSAPRSLAAPGSYVNVVHIAEQPRGGHFPAMEQPGSWADDMLAFFGDL